MDPVRFVVRDDLQLALYHWGPASPAEGTVVLVHGYPDSARLWTACAERLAERFDVFAYDVRGAGLSGAPGPTGAYALAELVADLAAVIDAVSPAGPVHLVGHDWGSIQSWEAVVSDQLQGRIASFTSISGPSLDHAGHWLRQSLGSGVPAHIAEVARQMSRSWYVGFFHLPGLAPALWSRAGERGWPRLLERMERVTAVESASRASDGRNGVKLYRANFRQRLARPRPRTTALPVQLVVAKGDRFMVPGLLESLSQWVPNLWRRDIQAGHWVPLSHPALLADWIGEFLDRVDRGRDSAALRRAQRRAAPAARPYAGRLVVVTGAGSGIGRETLLLFAEQGADVVAADIDRAAAERSAELARLLGAEAVAHPVDVGDVAAMEAFAAWVDRELGAPDIVVNNAGIGMAGPLLKTRPEEWKKILDINLGGVIHGSTLFARQMLAQGKAGHIVNVSSGLAYFPTRSTPAYATTKAAVRMLSECLRAEVSGRGIGVSAVYPGIVDTGIVTRTRFVGSDGAQEQQQRSRIQQWYARRNLKPAAVARAIQRAVETNDPEVLVGVEVAGIRAASRYLPSLTRRLARVGA